MKVTAETISDAQIIRLHEEIRYEIERLVASTAHVERALGRGVFSEDLIKLSRARCADLWNARNGGGE